MIDLCFLDRESFAKRVDQFSIGLIEGQGGVEGEVEGGGDVEGEVEGRGGVEGEAEGG